MTPEIEQYITERVDDQFLYFDSKAIVNQRRYKFLKTTMIVCNVLTTITIVLAFVVLRDYETTEKTLGILALILSIIVLATYQIEEVHHFGAKWERFRLVAEQLKSEKLMYLNGGGVYAGDHSEEDRRHFIETVEGFIRQTDIVYYSLMDEPGKRIEKGLQLSRQQKLTQGEYLHESAADDQDSPPLY